MERELGPASLLAQVSTLRHPPAQFDAGGFRDVFNRLSRVETFNYTAVAGGAELATPPRESGDQIKISLGKDTVRIGFDPTTKSADFAAEELIVIMKEITSSLPIPVFIHQSHVLRKTMPLSGGLDARTFLLESVAHVPSERLASWKRGFASLGLRFIFPPQKVDELSSHDLKVESYVQDPVKVFVENTASFLVPMPSGQWDTLKKNLAEANRFLDEYANSLLNPRLSPEA